MLQRSFSKDGRFERLKKAGPSRVSVTMAGCHRPCFPPAASFGAGESMWFIIFLLVDVTRWRGVRYRTCNLPLMP